MNGAVDFRYDVNGWRVAHVWDFSDIEPHPAVASIPFYGCVMVTGKFKTKPRAGQYCKRPHKLLKGA